MNKKIITILRSIFNDKQFETYMLMRVWMGGSDVHYSLKI